MKDTNELKYVLYARKSSESDERQAISIDGQLMEMKEKVKEIIKINPKDADIYPLYATSLIRIGDLLNAVEQYRIASELDDKYWSKYNNLKNAVDVIVEYDNRKK